MTVQQLLRAGASILRAGPDPDTATLDARILLQHTLNLTQEAVYTRYLEAVSPEQAGRFRAMIAERRGGIPVAYLTGLKEFYGREFGVNRHVLIPRPDSETLVDAVLELARTSVPARGPEAGTVHSPEDRPLQIHDACTGSGCVAITLAAELEGKAEISMSDISAEAVSVARDNARRILGYELPADVADSLEAIRSPVDIVTANPPYVPTSQVALLGGRPCNAQERSADGAHPRHNPPRHAGEPTMSPAPDKPRTHDSVPSDLATSRPLNVVPHFGEPRHALEGGESGLEVSSRIVHTAVEKIRPNGYLVLETADELAEQLVDLLRDHGFGNIFTRRDLAGRIRVVGGRHVRSL